MKEINESIIIIEINDCNDLKKNKDRENFKNL